VRPPATIAAEIPATFCWRTRPGFQNRCVEYLAAHASRQSTEQATIVHRVRQDRGKTTREEAIAIARKLYSGFSPNGNVAGCGSPIPTSCARDAGPLNLSHAATRLRPAGKEYSAFAGPWSMSTATILGSSRLGPDPERRPAHARRRDLGAILEKSTGSSISQVFAVDYSSAAGRDTGAIPRRVFAPMRHPLRSPSQGRHVSDNRPPSNDEVQDDLETRRLSDRRPSRICTRTTRRFELSLITPASHCALFARAPREFEKRQPMGKCCVADRRG